MILGNFRIRNGKKAGIAEAEAKRWVLRFFKSKTAARLDNAQTTALRVNFRRIERREWWLWAAAAIITLLLTIGLASFLLPNAHSREDTGSLIVLPQAIRGLVALVFLFDLYTIYQHL